MENIIFKTLEYPENKNEKQIQVMDSGTKETYANIWIDNLGNEIETECDHAFVEYGDDETVGECPICGATCDWHWQESADDGYTIKEQIPHDWHKPEKTGGIIGEYLKNIKES